MATSGQSSRIFGWYAGDAGESEEGDGVFEFPVELCADGTSAMVIMVAIELGRAALETLSLLE